MRRLRGAGSHGRADPRCQAPRRRRAGAAAIGWSNRLGWFEGLRLLLAVTPTGAVTGFALAPGNIKDQPLAETFFRLRRHPHRRGTGVGTPAAGPYVADKGFEGRSHHQHWHQSYGAMVICSPKRTSLRPWPKFWRRWLAGTRQVVETVIDKLFHTFRLDRERPHALAGVQTRVAAKIALHNFCLWLNGNLGRPHLAFAELVDWGSRPISHQAFKIRCIIDLTGAFIALI